MKATLTALLQLVRLPNIFTAVADVLAGYCMVAWPHWQTIDPATLIGCSAAFYGGGCALNDYCDRLEDRVKRPRRPIPSGRISAGTALVISLVLLGAAVTLAFLVGLQSGLLAVLLLALIVSYDCFAKKILFLGALNMGSCRGLNLLLGMSVAPFRGFLLFFPLCSFFYVSALSMVAEYESGGAVGKTAGVTIAFVFLIVLSLLSFSLFNKLPIDGFVFLLLFSALIFPPLLHTWRCRQDTNRTVKYMILGLPLLDGYYAASYSGMAAGLLVAACLIPSIALSKKIVMT